MNEALKTIEAQKLLTSIKKGLEDVKNGKTKPINDLWKKLES